MFTLKLWIQHFKYLKLSSFWGIANSSLLGSHSRNLDWGLFKQKLSFFTLHIHLHYHNAKCTFLGFAGWKPLVTVSKPPSVSQSWRLSSRKGESWNTTGRAKGKASGRAWKHPSGEITGILLCNACWQSIAKTALTPTFHDGQGPLCPSVCTAEQSAKEVLYLEI